MENAFSVEAVDALFARTATQQREGELLFSTVVDLLSLTVCGVRKSVNAAYVAAKERVEVSVKSVYNKLNGVETQVSRELVRQTAARLRQVVQATGRCGRRPSRAIAKRYSTAIICLPRNIA